MTKKHGFTLVELMVTMSILLLVLSAAFSIYIMHQKLWRLNSLIMNTSQDSSLALEKLVYGVHFTPGLREAERDSVVVRQWPTTGKWRIIFDTPSKTRRRFVYDPLRDQVRGNSRMFGVLVENVLDSTLVETNNGVEVSIQVLDTIGGKSWTNEMTTFVQFRN